MGRPSRRTPTVLIVEPHPVCRLALCRLIWSVSPEFILAGEVSEIDDAVLLAQRVAPDIVLLALRDKNDCAWIARILGVAPATRIVTLALAEDGEAAFSALRAGAWAFAPKSAAVEDMIGTIRLVAAGEKVIHPSVTVNTLIWAAEQEASWIDARTRWETLTRRERDVLALLATAMRPRDIATRLFLSRRTVEWYLASAYRKLGVHGRIEAVRELQRLPMSLES